MWTRWRCTTASSGRRGSRPCCRGCSRCLRASASRTSASTRRSRGQPGDGRRGAGLAWRPFSATSLRLGTSWWLSPSRAEPPPARVHHPQILVLRARRRPQVRPGLTPFPAQGFPASQATRSTPTARSTWQSRRGSKMSWWKSCSRTTFRRRRLAATHTPAPLAKLTCASVSLLCPLAAINCVPGLPPCVTVAHHACSYHHGQG